MTLPDDPQKPTQTEPGVAEPAVSEPLAPVERAVSEPVAPAEPAPVTSGSLAETPPTAVPAEGAEEPRPGGGRKGTVAAVLAGAAAVANKVRQEAPKKVKEIREKRAAGRCVILTEVEGRQVAIGPYRDDQTARQDLGTVTGAPRVVELMSPTAYLGQRHGGTATQPEGR
jgi:hypothetical protein